MSYHFGKHLMRQTKWCKKIFDLGPISRVGGVKEGDLEGVIFFWELCNIYKIESLWNKILRDVCFCFLIWAPQGGRGAMYVYVLYRNPNHWTDLDEIWQVGGPWGWEGSWGVSTQYPHPRVQGVSGASAVHFGKNFIKQKLQGAPDLEGVGHHFWAPNPDLEGPGPHVLLETWSITMKVTW